ncbi:hypothetical protein Glove_390g72 [Diversispora epigaea]|uniref:Uncharacterized protein n=1 Tax=Diversispora epigaea TaxID=1348612 RepID=A0A397H2F6_9GLOM|nr:hypothetical protein Glove_390g72 [Diversispora epigaea]
MQASINKRKVYTVISQGVPVANSAKLSRHARACKNKKQRREQEQIATQHEPEYPLLPTDRNSSKESKTQQEISTRDLLVETLIREVKPVSNNPLGVNISLEIKKDSWNRSDVLSLEIKKAVKVFLFYQL